MLVCFLSGSAVLFNSIYFELWWLLDFALQFIYWHSKPSLSVLLFFLWAWENRELWVHSIIIIIYINAIFFKLLSYVALKFSFPHFLPRLILSLCHSFCLPYSLNLSRSFFSFSRQQRHISDSTVNNRRSKTLRNGELKDQRWSTIQVILELEERNLWQFWCIQSDLIEYRQFFVETAVERFMVSLSVIITFKASNQAKSQRGILNE